VREAIEEIRAAELEITERCCVYFPTTIKEGALDRAWVSLKKASFASH
jgi:hypothetical protein